MFASSAWLLVAAVMVGFAAAWLVLEVRRAWSPESVRVVDRDTVATVDGEELTQLVPTLVQEVTQLRREIAAVRAAELEVALRNRQRELQLAEALETVAAQAAPVADVTSVADAPAEDPSPDDAPPDDAAPDLTPGDIAALSTLTAGGRS